MLYTDGVHLTGSTLRELCEYATSINLNCEWLQLGGKNINPHLDICGKVRERVLSDDRVKQVTAKELIRICKMNYRQPESEEEIKEWENYHSKKIEDIYKPTETDFERMLKNIFRKSGL